MAWRASLANAPPSTQGEASPGASTKTATTPVQNFEKRGSQELSRFAAAPWLPVLPRRLLKVSLASFSEAFWEATLLPLPSAGIHLYDITGENVTACRILIPIVVWGMPLDIPLVVFPGLPLDSPAAALSIHSAVYASTESRLGAVFALPV